MTLRGNRGIQDGSDFHRQIETSAQAVMPVSSYLIGPRLKAVVSTIWKLNAFETEQLSFYSKRKTSLRGFLDLVDNNHAYADFITIPANRPGTSFIQRDYQLFYQDCCLNSLEELADSEKDATIILSFRSIIRPEFHCAIVRIWNDESEHSEDLLDRIKDLVEGGG